MISTNSNNSSCAPTVNSSTFDGSLVQLVYDATATSLSSSSTGQQPLAELSNAFSHRDLSSILGDAIKIVQEDGLFFPTNDVDDLFIVQSQGGAPTRQ
ncbi:unnamed protein product [Cylindrotheca closterium]|uniref:Uncharacterized protein n=1 Tax=Cylindrotheca closterium TaxID=2856 RepID=A0AAD2JG91_9STRA|nr:unnamed protein product [Cylindrotheca closterium]